MSGAIERQRYGTIVIGGGQAGLAAGYHLARRGLDFVILDASERIGDSWRQRWDSLRLFTPAAYNGLPGMRFPAAPHYFPTKDEMGDFLEEYAVRFDLPVRSGTRVDRLGRDGDAFVVTAGEQRLEADNVIVAMANYQQPQVPSFADELDPTITQIHSFDYRSPSQLRPGPVLIVGAGNSGSEVAMELAPRHSVTLSGRDTGEIPFRGRTTAARFVFMPLLLRFVFRKVLSVNTPVGRKVRPKAVSRGGPLIRVKRRDLAAAGVERVGRTAGVRDGRPVLDDGRVLDVANIVWCTGFRAGFESWIDLPVHGEHGPRHRSGVVPDQPGLYFTGLHFLRSLSSGMVQGASDDSAHVVRQLARRTTSEGRRAMGDGRAAVGAGVGAPAV